MDELFLNLFRDFGLGGGAFILTLGMLVAILLMFVRNARLKNETAAHVERARIDMQAEQQRQQGALQAQLMESLDQRIADMRADAERADKLYHEQIAGLQAQFDAYQTEAEAEKNEQRAALAALTTEKEALRQRIEELASELTKLKLLYQAERDHNAELTATNEDLQKVNARLVEENKSNIRQLADAQERMTALQNKVEDLERENKALQERVHELAQQVQLLTAGQSTNHNQPVETKQE